jgi:aryl-alcohol dehydrogenase-like predicted oxidoreductase
MGFSQSYGPAKDEESLQTLAKAVELGCTFWDTAAVYGCGHNETLLGRFFAENPGSREKVFVASKCGIEVSFKFPGTSVCV